MEETSIGLDENIAGALAYLFGFLTGIILLVMEKDNRFVRFHAAQSTVVFGAILVLFILLSVVSTVLGLIGLGIITFILWLLGIVVWLLAILLWLYLMFTAYKGNKTEIPGAAGLAEKLL
ncbi:Tic20 family membrane protein implicated in protein translocation [Methanonatronarchaeum thermophilum]|uniref:Tic20 family membrane protein implicated in protein translocation n=1 Tax=Methanonatronarchaeum thermophilum TaxID=1927129 RepID=A0A1Y3GB03_9EURY|nr:DUF4870 domain-containing protein [Methanonatronarchaeum thermophilum]OUJ18447.1 Tic20 family membrane protein implicated in protein translocation [Methanonatronarchaeum thermophilum]